ncbi:MAG: hypothetical protein ACP5E3_03575, partial [Bacteroidales bacterium]
MRKTFRNIITLAIAVLLLTIAPSLFATSGDYYLLKPLPEFTLFIPQPDTSDLQYPFVRKSYYHFDEPEVSSPLYLRDPSNVQKVVEYDPVTGTYQFSEKVGDIYYTRPSSMNRDEYFDYEMQQFKQDYWRVKTSGENLEGQSGFLPQINIGGEAFDRVFGSNTINIT